MFSFRALLSTHSLLLCVLSTPAFQSVILPRVPDDGSSKRQITPPTGVLTDFQVYEPVLTPTGTSNQYGCIYTQTLMVHDFAFSYGQPFVGSYTPPPCSFNRVTMNFTVTSAGRQFDRLALMYLGDIEVFRTSTAEPTAKGIVFTYVKEMQQYDALWKTNQKIIFDLGNLVDNTYTGIWHTTLTATFFTVPDSPPTADTILPISSRNSAANQGSVFSVPGTNASVAYTLPKNVQRAVVSLQACGQSTEEFWYTNVFTSQENTFAASTGALYGGSPFREVQLLIDGQLAGVSWPFPIIFTGGIVPGFWRPIVGIDAFDLREHEIDVTPWLPVLLDGNSHTFEIRVASLNDDGAGHASLVATTGGYWLVTGKIFLFLDKAGSVTTGTKPTIITPSPVFALSSSITQNSTGANETLIYNTAAKRQISISSTIKTSTGSQKVSWTQSLSYTNYGALTSQGLTQLTIQSTIGADNSASGYVNTYSYPLNVNSSYYQPPDGSSLSIEGALTRGLDFNVNGPAVFPSGIQNTPAGSVFKAGGLPAAQQNGITISTESASGLSASSLSTTQSATASYFSSKNGSYSFGTTTQDFSFKGAEAGQPGVGYELYTRHVKAVNSTIVEDSQSFAGQTFGVPTGVPAQGVLVQSGDGASPKAILGRGKGATKAQLGGGPSQ